MAETPEPADLVPEYLRRIDRRTERFEADSREVKTRLGLIETQAAGLHAMYATISTRVDDIGIRIERIEKRLDLVEA